MGIGSGSSARRIGLWGYLQAQEAFMASPELQQRAEAWHWQDIDNHIRQTGLDRAIGQTINGVPVTVEGMRAVAHLGGKKGLSQFIATGGRYNPADENGTRLSDYFSRHGGQPAPVQLAQAQGGPQADLPAQNAAPAQGFVVPPGGDAAAPSSLADNPRIQYLQRAYAAARTDKARDAIKSRMDLEIKDAERRAAVNQPTDVQRNYEAARKQGYQGTLLDYQRELRAQTNVNVDTRGEGEYAKTLGKAYGEQFVETQKAARDASKTIGTVNLMERLMQTPGFYSGLGSERSLTLNRALVSLGVKDAKAATAQEAFQALSNQLVLDASGGSLGAQISNGDRDYINATAPNLANTPEGNKQLLDIRRKLAERQSLVGKMARDYAKANKGRIDAGFDDELSQFAEANPLFPKPEAAAAPSGPPSVGEVRKGFRFKGGDPSQQSSWEKAK